jgi:hypothetical protein
MNEQIQQLAAKHALYVDGGAGKINYTFTKESLKEFAELIVRECAQDFDNTYMSGGKTMGAYIREKFGVEK